MSTINSVTLLKATILELEIKKKEQARILKEQFQTIKDNLKPANIIKSTFDEVATSPKLRSNLLGAFVGLAAAYASRKLVVGKSGNPFRKVLGSLLQLGLSAVVAKKPDLLRTLGQTIAKRVFTKINSYEPTAHQRN